MTINRKSLSMGMVYLLGAIVINGLLYMSLPLISMKPESVTSKPYTRPIPLTIDRTPPTPPEPLTPEPRPDRQTVEEQNFLPPNPTGRAFKHPGLSRISNCRP